jgi:hypothetical protein
LSEEAVDGFGEGAVAVLGAQAIAPPGATGVRLHLWGQQTPWPWMPVDLDPASSTLEVVNGLARLTIVPACDAAPVHRSSSNETEVIA